MVGCLEFRHYSKQWTGERYEEIYLPLEPWMEQPDPVVYITVQRMEELRNIGVASEGKSMLDVLVEVFAHWPKGADFLTLLAEINVVRRSSRRLIASLLSSYQCFYQRSGSPVWHFDAKKIDLGFDKTKRKFVRK